MCAQPMQSMTRVVNVGEPPPYDRFTSLPLYRLEYRQAELSIMATREVDVAFRGPIHSAVLDEMSSVGLEAFLRKGFIDRLGACPKCGYRFLPGDKAGGPMEDGRNWRLCYHCRTGKSQPSPLVVRIWQALRLWLKGSGQ